MKIQAKPFELAGKQRIKGSPASEFWIRNLWFLGETVVQMNCIK